MQSPSHSNEGLEDDYGKGGRRAWVKVDVDESYLQFKARLKLNS